MRCQRSKHTNPWYTSCEAMPGGRGGGGDEPADPPPKPDREKQHEATEKLADAASTECAKRRVTDENPYRKVWGDDMGWAMHHEAEEANKRALLSR